MSQKTTVAPPSPEEKAYLASQQALAAKQLEILGTQSDFNKSYMDSIKPIMDQQNQLLSQQLAAQNDPVAKEIAARTSDYQLQQIKDQQDLAPLQKQLLEKQLADAQRGFGATPEQSAQIDAATQGALQSGQSDLTAFSGDAMRQLRENLAPSLGLRPTDTPILDRGALVAQEATRQYGKLVSDLSTANAEAKLNYPLAAAGVGNAASQFQQGLGLSKDQFSAQLADAAVQNRMALLGQGTSSLGLGMGTGVNLVGASRPNSLSFQRNTSVSDPWGYAAKIAGGIGMAVAASDARVKDDVKTIAHDPKGHRWVSFKYKGDPHNLTRIGVIAQEVEKIDPEAVLTNGLGLKFVNYDKLRMG